MTTISSFRKAIEARDIAAASRALAPDVMFLSPVVPRPYQGREKVTKLLEVLEQVFEEFRYTNELVGEALYGDLPADRSDRTQALIFSASVGGKRLQGLDLLTYDESGMVSSLMVMVRPLPAAMTLARMVGARMTGAIASG